MTTADQTSPYGELTLNYAVAQNTNLSWTNRYSIEESDVPELSEPSDLSHRCLG